MRAFRFWGMCVLAFVTRRGSRERRSVAAEDRLHIHHTYRHGNVSAGDLIDLRNRSAEEDLSKGPLQKVFHSYRPDVYQGSVIGHAVTSLSSKQLSEAEKHMDKAEIKIYREAKRDLGLALERASDLQTKIGKILCLF